MFKKIIKLFKKLDQNEKLIKNIAAYEQKERKEQSKASSSKRNKRNRQAVKKV